ncbi:MAG: ribonuclease H-like domain-containing protein [Acidobacteriaceae bacterium]
MTNRYLAFDIETAKDVPGEDFNWRPHRPLGISCAATLASDMAEPVLWHGKTEDGSPAGRMSRDDAQKLARYLVQMAAEGYKILTWNGLGFDFDILAEESCATASCKECAVGHVDMMFHAFCVLGYPIALEKVALGMGLPGKPPGMSGIKAPKLWAEGERSKVLDYVAQDVRIALQVAQACEQRRSLEWITRRGTIGSMPLMHGWVTVKEALRFPEPDTSWMSAPIPRNDFIAWLTDKYLSRTLGDGYLLPD